jgi:hypothetical protein
MPVPQEDVKHLTGFPGAAEIEISQGAGVHVNIAEGLAAKRA